jgi:hypothetical protein
VWPAGALAIGLTGVEEPADGTAAMSPLARLIANAIMFVGPFQLASPLTFVASSGQVTGEGAVQSPYTVLSGPPSGGISRIAPPPPLEQVPSLPAS